MADTQKVSPSTVYNVQGSPDDYDYVLKGADLILINKQTQEEQTFLFVGNIMSLDGQVNMNFSDGNSLQSQDVFNRSTMLDMGKQDEEAPEWEAVSDESTPSDEEGNSEEGNLAGEQVQPIQTAQAALMTDPTDDILKSQQRMFDDINKFAEQDSLSSDVSSQGSQRLEAEDRELEDKKEEEKEDKPEPQPEDDLQKPDPQDDPKTDTKETIGNTTIDLADDSDSGISNTDNITNKSTLEIKGTADPGATVKILVDGEPAKLLVNGELKDTLTADEDGNFSGEITRTSGIYTIQAESSFDGTELTSKSSTLKVEVDTSAPTINDDATVESTAPSVNGFEDVDAGKTYTNESRPLLEGTGEKGTILTITYSSDNGDSGTIENVVVNDNGNWSCRVPEGKEFSDGQYTFTITGADAAGNDLTADRQIQNVYVKLEDSFNPNATIALDIESDSKGTHSLAEDGDRVTYEEDIDLTINLNDESVRKVTVYHTDTDGNKTELGTAEYDSVNKVWTYTVDYDDIPDDDTYTFWVEATDVAGNTTNPGYFLPVTIDRTVEPAQNTGLTIDLDPNSDSGDSRELLGREGADVDADHYTHGAEEGTDGIDKGFIRITGTNAGAGGQVRLYIINADNSKTLIDTGGNISADGDGNWHYDNFDASIYGTDGEQTLTIRAEITDIAGNIEYADLNVTIDNDAPVESTIFVEGALETKETAEGLFTSVTGNNVTLSGIITEGKENVIVTLYDKDGNEIANSAQNPDLLKVEASGDDFKWSYIEDGENGTGVVDGQQYSYYVTVEDAAGNISKSDVINVTSDQGTGKPDIVLDASTDTSTKGDNITDFVTEDDNGTKVESHNINLKVTADDDATLEVYQVFDTAAEGRIDLGNGLYGVKIETGGDIVNGDVVTFTADAATYDDKATELKFVTVATDEAGNTNTSDVYTMVLDDSLPVDQTGITVTAVLSEDGATTAACPDGEYSNAKALVLSGSFTDLIDTDIDVPSPVVRVYDNGTKIGIATVTVDADGEYSWSFKLGDESNVNANVVAKDYSFTIEIEDAAGNITTVPADANDTIDVHIDRTPPEITAVLANDAEGHSMDTGLENNDWITKIDSGLKIDVTINEADPDTISVVLNGVTYTRDLTTAEINAGVATIDLANPDGETDTPPTLNTDPGTSNSVSITVTDKAGNTSEPFTESLVIDTTDPTGDILLNDDDNAGDKTDTITTVTNPTLEGKTEAGAKIELKILKLDGDGHLISTLDSEGNVTSDNGGVAYEATIYADDHTGDWDVTPSTLPAGSYKVVATVTDVAGNTQMIDMDTDLVIAPDLDPPSAQLLNDTTPYFFSAEDTTDDGITSDNQGEFSVTKSAGAYVTVRYWEVNSSGDRIGDIQTNIYNEDSDISALAINTDAITGGLDDGHYVFEFTATDDASQISSTPVEVAITVDTTDPAAAISKVQNGDTELSADNGVYLTNADNPEITISAEAKSQVRMMVFKEGDDGYDFADLSDSDNLKGFVTTYLDDLDDNVVGFADGVWTANPSFDSNPEDTNYKVVLVAEDEAGNLSAQVVEFHHDSEPPVKPSIALTVDEGVLVEDGYTDENNKTYDSTTDLTPTLSGTASKDATGEITTKIVITNNDDESYSKTLEAGKDFTIDPATGNWSYHYGDDGNFTHIRGGNYTATITSTDEAGNESKDYVEFHIEQDVASAPTIGLDSSQITGGTYEGITYTSLEILDNDSDPDNDSDQMLLQGKAIAYSEVQLYAGDDAPITIDVDSEGNWSYPLTTEQKAEGTIEYYVICEGKKSETFTLKIDNDIDTDPTINISTEHDSGSDNSDWVTKDPTISGDVEKGSTVTITATRVYTLTADGDTYTYIKGESTVTISAEDAAALTANNSIYTGDDGKTYFADSADVKEYTVDSKDTEGGSYSKDIKTLTSGGTLADGQYQITVTSTDKANNTESFTSDKLVVLDTGTTVPTVELHPDSDTSFTANELKINGGDTDVYDDLPTEFKEKADDGDFKIDKLTNESTPILQGEAEAGALISIAIDGTSGVYTTNAGADGHWSLQLTNALSDGEHVITVTATDTAGNDESSSELTIKIDSSLSTDADITVVNGTVGHDGGDSTPDIFYTSETDATLSLRGESGAAYILYCYDEDTGKYVKVAGGVLASDTTYTVQETDYPDNTLVTDLDGTVHIDDGAHQLKYKLVTIDEAGTAQTSDYTVDVDTAPPDTATQIDYGTTKDPGSELINLTNNTASIHTSDNKTDLVVHTAADTARVELWDKTTNTMKCSAQVSDGTATLVLEEDDKNSIDDGTQIYIIKFIDDVGNHTDTSDVELTMTVDTAPTTVDSVVLDSDSDRGFDANDGITSGEIYTFTGTFTEETTNYANIGYTITITSNTDDADPDNDFVWTYTHNPGADGTTEHDAGDYIHSVNVTESGEHAGSYSFDINDPNHSLANGDYTVTVTATDEAGNTSAEKSAHITIDNHTMQSIENINVADGTNAWGETTIQVGMDNYGDDGDASTARAYHAELTAYDNDAHSSTTQTQNLVEGDDIRLSITDKHDIYDYAEVKVIDSSGNESDSKFIDLDKSDLHYTADVGDKTIDDVKVTITGEFDSTHSGTETVSALIDAHTNEITLVDTNTNQAIASGEKYGVTVHHDEDTGSWSLDFSNSLLQTGDFEMHISGIDNDTDSSVELNTKDIGFTLSDMNTGTVGDEIFNSAADSAQDFNGAKDGNGGNTADTTSDTHTIVETEVHQDHIEFNIA
ncbi:Ig-like domain-containing protein [Maridesulfovibrio sp.]|uniref:Ig-like domain-containing protein n=1 Tax=Maridesulfovibrio sp. TaxID=2795000 RepID=UPI0039F0744E